MAGDSVPTPDQAEHALFLIKWWKEFLLGVGAVFGIFATIKKGQRVPIAVTMTSEAIDQKMELCKHRLKNEIHDDIRTIMHEHKEEISDKLDDMVEKIELMIKVATK